MEVFGITGTHTCIAFVGGGSEGCNSWDGQDNTTHNSSKPTAAVGPQLISWVEIGKHNYHIIKRGGEDINKADGGIQMVRGGCVVAGD